MDSFTGIPVVILSSVFLPNKEIPYRPALYLNSTSTIASYNTAVQGYGGQIPLILRLGIGHGPEKIVLIKALTRETRKPRCYVINTFLTPATIE